VPIYRVTFGFAGNNEGWTETHACQSSQVTPLAVISDLVNLQLARVAMLGDPFVMNGCRVSIYSDGGNPPNRLPRQAALDKTLYSQSSYTGLAASAEPSAVSMQAQGYAPVVGAPAGFGGNENWTYLGGPFDVCITDAGFVNKGKNNLLTNFNTWKQQMLTNNFGWLADQTLNPGAKIVSVTQNADGTVTYTCEGVIAGVVEGGKYPVRVRGMNGGKSPLNGPFNVIVGTPAITATTLEQVAFATAQKGGFIRFYQACKVFVPYGNIVLAGTTIEHKRGRAFLSRRGRASKRIRA
jgi:hypothetical protein